jgi:pimeloyl-ACP methyl ester carboxylesterase
MEALRHALGITFKPALVVVARRLFNRENLVAWNGRDHSMASQCSIEESCQPPATPATAAHVSAYHRWIVVAASRTVAYAKSGDVNIAYQVTGDGPFDLVLVHGFFSHLEMAWEHPDNAAFLERLGSFARLIRFDKRGTGLSDRAVGLPDLETRMDDVRAVMDAVGSERAALFGYSEGGPMCALFAATYPDRVRALVLYGSYARRLRTDDYPWAPTWENRVATAAELEAHWGENVDLSTMWPGADPADAAWFARLGRAALSPAAARDLILMNAQVDVRDVLPAIQCPTLVLHRTGDRDSSVEEGRYIADHIPGARFVELPGDVHVPWVDMDQVLDPVEEFLTGVRPAKHGNRVLATIAFTDIVGSTDRARELGDAGWSRLLGQHHDAVRRLLPLYGGIEVDTAGDGFVARFDGPARAIRCGLAIRDALRALGIEVRVAVHTGEVELVPEGPRGIAVHFAARILSLTQPGQVLVSQTTRDLVEGSGIAFTDRGEHELKGIEGRRQVFSAI